MCVCVYRYSRYGGWYGKDVSVCGRFGDGDCGRGSLVLHVHVHVHVGEERWLAGGMCVWIVHVHYCTFHVYIDGQ